MTGNELRLARTRLGKMWGWNRAVFASELGRALLNPARDPGEMIRDHESRRDAAIPWPLASSVQLLLNGALPPGGIPVRHYDQTVKRPRAA